MTQTTDQVWGGCAKIEYSDDCITYNDISGHSNQVNPGDATRQSGEAYTFDGDVALVTFGKREPFDIEVRLIYTEELADGWYNLKALFETVCAGGAVCIRWSPKGGSGGDFQFTTPSTVITSFQYPPAQADDANPIMVSFKVRVPYVTYSVVAT